jgi:hypothetical protein
MFGLDTLFVTGLLATSAIAAPTHKLQGRGGAPKRGLSFNNAGILGSLLDKLPFSWSYNWANAPSAELPGTEFVPMLWGPKMFDGWEKAAEEALSNGATHLLGFNEPDHPDQANMSPADAAQAWQKYMNPYAGRAKLGSPGVTNSGNPGVGLEWLEAFFVACAGQCKVDFLAVHWYAPGSATEYFKQHMDKAISLGNSHGVSEVWLTEFQAQGDEVSFMKEVLPWLDGNDAVGRYAYFMADLMVNGDSLTGAGAEYCA